MQLGRKTSRISARFLKTSSGIQMNLKPTKKVGKNILDARPDQLIVQYSLKKKIPDQSWIPQLDLTKILEYIFWYTNESKTDQREMINSPFLNFLEP